MKSFIDLLDEANAEIKTITVKELELIINQPGVTIIDVQSKDVISNCHQCGEPFDTHVNCKNVNCNLLFLQCDKCKIKYENCCSVECIKTIHLPIDKQKEIRKGSGKKKMYYSHKRVNLNLNNND